jgi:hypothetical protein
VDSGGASWPIAAYMLALAAISSVSVSLARETHQADIGAEPALRRVAVTAKTATSGASL